MDLIEYGYNPKRDEKPWVEKLTVTYCQNDDCCGEKDAIQSITLTSEDNGVAPFIRISIPHEEHDPGYWSISDINDLKLIVEDFEKRLNFKENE